MSTAWPRAKMAIGSWRQSVRDAFRLRFDGADPERAKLLWLLRLRWIACGLLMLAIVVGLILGTVDGTSVPAFMGLAGILIVFNLLAQLVWSDRTRIVRPPFVAFQLTIDVVILSALLMLSRGANSPFIAIFLLHGALGATLLDGRRQIIFQIILHQFLFLVQLGTFWGDGLPTKDELISAIGLHILLLAIGLMMRSLGQALESQRERLLNLKIIIERSDRLRAVGALAAGFSHEFASPLNTAKIRLARVQAKLPSPDATEALIAVEECSRILRQMNQSQIDPRDFSLMNVNLREVTERIVNSWLEQLPETEVEIFGASQTNTKIPLVNYSQALINLLDNAQEAKPNSKIKISIENGGQEFRVNVEDSGPGFPNEVLTRLGEPFLTTKSAGTGLGLYSAQLFALSLGGSLQIESASPCGSKVILRWPATDVAQELS